MSKFTNCLNLNTNSITLSNLKQGDKIIYNVFEDEDCSKTLKGNLGNLKNIELGDIAYSVPKISLINKILGSKPLFIKFEIKNEDNKYNLYINNILNKSFNKPFYVKLKLPNHVDYQIN